MQRKPALILAAGRFVLFGRQGVTATEFAFVSFHRRLYIDRRLDGQFRGVQRTRYCRGTSLGLRGCKFRLWPHLTCALAIRSHARSLSHRTALHVWLPVLFPCDFPILARLWCVSPSETWPAMAMTPGEPREPGDREPAGQAPRPQEGCRDRYERTADRAHCS